MFLNELGLKNKFSNLNSYVICIYYYAYINEIRCVINDNDYAILDIILNQLYWCPYSEIN